MKVFHLQLLILTMAINHGCTGGDPESDTETADAAVSVQFDSMPTGDREGVLCFRESPTDLRGNCAEGYVCLGSPLFVCHKECPTFQERCTGYQGPGSSFCGEYIIDGNGQIAGYYCIIVCDDQSGSFPGCETGTCDGTCPGLTSCEQSEENFDLKMCEPCDFGDCDL